MSMIQISNARNNEPNPQVVLDKCGVTPYVYADILVPLFGNFGGSLAWAILFVVLNWIPGYWLYKKRIYIKL